MAFLRRKGNTFYLVHNVREGDRVKQLHLAKLGERPRITDDVVRQVSRSYPFVDVNWNELREQVNNRVELYDPKSNQVQKGYFFSLTLLGSVLRSWILKPRQDLSG